MNTGTSLTEPIAEDMDINGVKLHYTHRGIGQPIILMHGWGCSHSTIESIECIALPYGTVYNLDLPGFGQSAEPPFNWGVEDYTSMLEGFINRLGIENPILLGHSFGGRIGIMYSSAHPVKKLILVDAAGVKPRRSLKYYLKIYSFKASKQLAILIHGREKAQAIIDEKRKKHSSADYAQASPRMRGILSRTVNQDLKHLMPSIQAPTLLIWGENDTATPLSDARTMERLIPDAGLVSFPGCGHYSFLDNPRQFAAVLKSFLAS